MTGDDIRNARKTLHYSQETLAVAAGVSRKTVQNAEAGQPLSAETRRAILAVLSSAMPTGTSREDDADEVETLIAAWVAPATPIDRLIRAQRAAGLAMVGFIASTVLVCLLLFIVPKAAVIKYILFTPVLAAAAAARASIRLDQTRTESDVDNERAAFRERLKRDGLDAWRSVPA